MRSGWRVRDDRNDWLRQWVTSEWRGGDEDDSEVRELQGGGMIA
jgi:hypothetical protein